MYLPSQTWYFAAVEETETFDELLFPCLDFLFSLDHQSAWLASAYGLGYTTDLTLVSGKKSPTLEKEVHCWFHSSTGQMTGLRDRMYIIKTLCQWQCLCLKPEPHVFGADQAKWKRGDWQHSMDRINMVHHRKFCLQKVGVAAVFL